MMTFGTHLSNVLAGFVTGNGALIGNSVSSTAFTTGIREVLVPVVEGIAIAEAGDGVTTILGRDDLPWEERLRIIDGDARLKEAGLVKPPVSPELFKILNEAEVAEEDEKKRSALRNRFGDIVSGLSARRMSQTTWYLSRSWGPSLSLFRHSKWDVLKDIREEIQIVEQQRGPQHSGEMAPEEMLDRLARDYAHWVISQPVDQTEATRSNITNLEMDVAKTATIESPPMDNEDVLAQAGLSVGQREEGGHQGVEASMVTNMVRNQQIVTQTEQIPEGRLSYFTFVETGLLLKRRILRMSSVDICLCPQLNGHLV